jgi:hypothetical protein
LTLSILSNVPNRETRNAELFKDALLQSEPRLEHPDINAFILCNLNLPEREIDLVLLYYDPRPENLQLKTTNDKSIHSFVLIVEVKQHSPDLVRFEGTKVHVRYGKVWKDATDQITDQMYALKSYQEAQYRGRKFHYTTFVQHAIWLARAPRAAFPESPASSRVPVYFQDLEWQRMVDGFEINRSFGAVRTLVDDNESQNADNHSLKSLLDILIFEVRPTRLDLKRVNNLTQTRFDAEKTAYIKNLGNGLLILRGRGGTGKTFALIQVALHLARQGKRTVILTYNHCLIADVNRALIFIARKEPNLNPIPKIQTRYTFIQDTFIQRFGETEEQRVRNGYRDYDKREEARSRQLIVPGKRVQPSYDFVLIDEGQDWSEEQRDVIFQIVGANQVVVADGIDQFVGSDRCNWDRGDISINRRHSLRASRRTKAATCQTVAEIARELGVSDWDLEPDPETYGGRFTVYIEPNGPIALKRGLEILEADQREDPSVKAVDNLVCLPTSTMAKGIDYEGLFDREIELSSRDSWRGFDQEGRRIYPRRESQLRATRYQSCRGMEGWTTLCIGLDAFFDYQWTHPRINAAKFEDSFREIEGLLFSQEKSEKQLAHEKKMYAVNWLMIPLTRSIDHLAVHLTDDKSELGKVLRTVSDQYPGSVEWL